MDSAASADAGAELLAAQQVTAGMYLEHRAFQGEDTGQLEGHRRRERLEREAAGCVLGVDVRFRVFRVRRWRMPCVVPQGRHRRAPAARSRISRQGRSRSGRGSPPGDPPDPEVPGDAERLTGASRGAVLWGRRSEPPALRSFRSTRAVWPIFRSRREPRSYKAADLDSRQRHAAKRRSR